MKSETGVISKDMIDAITFSDEDVDGQTKILWKDEEDRGWKPEMEYHWKLQHRPLSGMLKLHVYEGDNLIFATPIIKFDHLESPGKVGVFVRSQEQSNWLKMSYECNDDILS